MWQNDEAEKVDLVGVGLVVVAAVAVVKVDNVVVVVEGAKFRRLSDSPTPLPPTWLAWSSCHGD